MGNPFIDGFVNGIVIGAVAMALLIKYGIVHL